MTPNELIRFFRDESERQGKLFVPDPPRQDQVAKSLLSYTAKYSTEEILLESIKLFIESRTESILVFDYAIGAKEFRDKVEEDIRSKEKFEKILEQTRKRHEKKEEASN